MNWPVLGHTPAILSFLPQSLLVDPARAHGHTVGPSVCKTAPQRISRIQRALKGNTFGSQVPKKTTSPKQKHMLMDVALPFHWARGLHAEAKEIGRNPRETGPIVFTTFPRPPPNKKQHPKHMDMLNPARSIFLFLPLPFGGTKKRPSFKFARPFGAAQRQPPNFGITEPLRRSNHSVPQSFGAAAASGTAAQAAPAPRGG